MSEKDIRAWKDPKFRAELNASESGSLPENPAGQPLDEMSDDDAEGVAGGVTFPVTSGGNVCTATTECPILSICCQSSA